MRRDNDGRMVRLVAIMGVRMVILRNIRVIVLGDVGIVMVLVGIGVVVNRRAGIMVLLVVALSPHGRRGGRRMAQDRYSSGNGIGDVDVSKAGAMDKVTERGRREVGGGDGECCACWRWRSGGVRKGRRRRREHFPYNSMAKVAG